MGIGPIGGTGKYAVSRVPEERRVDSELAPIHRHNLEAEVELERAKTCDLVTSIHVQVNTFSSTS